MTRRALATLVATIFALSVCAPASTGGGPQSSPKPKEITVLQSADIKTFDPSMAFGSHELNVQAHVFDGLAAIDPELNQKEWLATSWKMLTTLRAIPSG